MNDIVIGDVLEALRKHSERTEGGEGARVEELAKLSGISEEKVRKSLARGIEDGTITRSKRTIKRLDGMITTVPAYRRVSSRPKTYRKGES